MSTEKEDKAILNLEALMRGDKKRTVTQNRISQMMGNFQKRLTEERVEAERQARALAACSAEVLAQPEDERQDVVDDELGEASAIDREVPLRR